MGQGLDGGEPLRRGGPGDDPCRCRRVHNWGVFYFCVVFFGLTAGWARPPVSVSLRPQWMETSLRYEMRHSAGNYNAEGRNVSLPSANSFWQGRFLGVQGRYSFSPYWAVVGEIQAAEVQANVASSTKTNGGFQSFGAGLQNRSRLGRTDLIFEILAQGALLTVEPTSVAPIYGDGAHSGGGKIWLLHPIGNTQIYGSVGYLYRSDDLSGLAPYSAGLRWRVGSFVFGGGLEGVWSINEDLERQSQRITFLNRTSGGSFSFRSWNPDLHGAEAYARWDWSRQMAVTAGLGQSFMGRNSAQTTLAFLTLDIRWQVFQRDVRDRLFKNAEPSDSTPFMDWHEGQDEFQ